MASSSTCISSITTAASTASSAVWAERIFRRAAYRPHPHKTPQPPSEDEAAAAEASDASANNNPYACWLQAIRSSLF